MFYFINFCNNRAILNVIFIIFQNQILLFSCSLSFSLFLLIFLYRYIRLLYLKQISVEFLDCVLNDV